MSDGMLDGWTRHTWACGECRLTMSADIHGDISGVHVVHGERHTLSFPPSGDPFWVPFAAPLEPPLGTRFHRVATEQPTTTDDNAGG